MSRSKGPREFKIWEVKYSDGDAGGPIAFANVNDVILKDLKVLATLIFYRNIIEKRKQNSKIQEFAELTNVERLNYNFRDFMFEKFDPSKFFIFRHFRIWIFQYSSEWH